MIKSKKTMDARGGGPGRISKEEIINMVLRRKRPVHETEGSGPLLKLENLVKIYGTGGNSWQSWVTQVPVNPP